MEKNYDALRLDHQLCFPLYACSREVIKLYNPYLSKLDLTYTQYIALMVLWEKQEINVKSLGEELYLDSGTLSSVLKKLEAKGLLSRQRSKVDERNLIVRITEDGMAMRDRAAQIPEEMIKCMELEPEEAAELYRILYKLLKR